MIHFYDKSVTFILKPQKGDSALLLLDAGIKYAVDNYLCLDGHMTTGPMAL